MTHWTDKYISGYRYDSDTSNCGHLVEIIQREVFNRDIDFIVPKESESYEVVLETINSQREQVVQVEHPEEGDLVLLYLHGKATHIGTVWFRGKQMWILHGMDRKKSIVNTELNALLRWGMKVEGFYRPIDKENNKNNESNRSQSESVT